MQIGLITCRFLPEPDPDEAILAAALRECGHIPVQLAWDDPRSELRDFDVFVLRSPWNYYERPTDFLNWIDRAAICAPVINSPAIVRWNIHKGYLLELAKASVPVVPTHLVVAGGFRAADLKKVVAEFGGVVVKPCIGAGSYGVRRFQRDEQNEALAYLEDLASRADALVQPLLKGFQSPGERSLIWIDSAWTHAIRKHPRFVGEHERVDSSEAPSVDEIAVAERALAASPTGCRYARADLVRDSAGGILLSELELMEPSLYFEQSPAALWRFVSMVEREAAGIREEMRRAH